MQEIQTIIHSILELGGALRRPRFSFDQALFFFAIPAALLMFIQSRRRDKKIIKSIVGVQRRLRAPVTILTPSGVCAIDDFNDYATLILSIALPDQNPRYKEGVGVARRALLIAWTEIASGQDVAHIIELGRFSAFAALDAAINAHPNYKKQPDGWNGTKWGFKARLQYFAIRASEDTMHEISVASGYTVEEMRTSAIACLAETRNVTGHYKEQTLTSRTPSSVVDLRPIHLAAALISALTP